MSENNKWANPGPTGLFALGIVLITLCAQMTGFISSSSAPIIIGFVLMACFAQTLVGIIEIKNGNIVVGNLMLTFGIFFCGGVAISNLIGFFAPDWFISKVGHAPNVLLGLILCYLAITLVFFLPLLTRAPLALFLIILVAAPTVFCMGLLDLGMLGEHCHTILGWICGICGLVILYIGGAELVNEGLHKHVLPLGNPLASSNTKKDSTAV